MPRKKKSDLASKIDPEAHKREVAFKNRKALVTAAAGTVPVAGGVITALFERFIVNPAEQRQDNLIQGLLDDVEQLSIKLSLTMEKLLSTDEASAIVLQVASIASRSYGDIKLKALRNAAVNGIVSREPSKTSVLVSLGILDRITEGHVKILKIVMDRLASRNSLAWKDGFSAITAGLSQPEDNTEIASRRIVLDDLCNLGLLRIGFRSTASHISDFSTDPTENGVDTLESTLVGSALFQHISEPMAEAPNTPHSDADGPGK